MTQKILVTYASRSGSTAEVAEAIATTLMRNGAVVEVRPMQDVNSIASYDGIIIGSPVRKSRWLPEALNFVQDHQVELVRKRVAMFTLSITLAMGHGEQYRHAVTEWTSPVRAQLKPISEALFPGRLDFHKLPLTLDTLKMRLVTALGIFPKDDRRDWKAIYAWAESLPPLLLG